MIRVCWLVEGTLWILWNPWQWTFFLTHLSLFPYPVSCCPELRWWGHIWPEVSEGFAWWEQLCTECTFVFVPPQTTPPFFSRIYSWKYNICLSYLLCNLSNIATLKGYLCTSCSDRSHEVALLRLHPVLSNQNMHSFSRPNITDITHILFTSNQTIDFEYIKKRK